MSQAGHVGSTIFEKKTPDSTPKSNYMTLALLPRWSPGKKLSIFSNYFKERITEIKSETVDKKCDILSLFLEIVSNKEERAHERNNFH